MKPASPSPSPAKTEEIVLVAIVASASIAGFFLSHLHWLGYGIYRQIVMINPFDAIGGVQTPLRVNFLPFGAGHK